MKKQQQKFRRLEEAKERHRKLSSARIIELLNSGYITKEGRVAYREELQERGVLSPADCLETK